MQKLTGNAEALSILYQKLLKSRSLPLSPFRKKNNYVPVLGDGNPNASIVFVGEAPGRKEAETGKPFVGAAGRILDDLLSSAGINRDTVYITNIVNDRPPKNRDPSPDEISRYKPFTLAVLSIIRPNVIATLGRISQRTVMTEYHVSGLSPVIGASHGQITPITTPFGQAIYIPLYHPAAAIYNPALRPQMKQDMQVVRNVADRTDN